MADKYFVVPIDAWLDEWKKHEDTPNAEHPLTDLQRHRIKDAVVIRRQDHFAPGALHAYAANISMTVRAIKDVADQLPADLAAPLIARCDSLQRTADYFHEQAVLAEAEAWKLPD